MAKYRQVHTTFWDDGFVLDLTPEEKYFYLYLMTNGNTTQCGIYELPYRVIEMHTGYNRETVLKLLQRFVDYKKITYNEATKEIMIHNWSRYNFINSPKVKKCIEKELEAVKHKGFVKEYAESLIRYGYGIDGLSIDLGEEEEKEQEQEREEEQEQQEEKIKSSVAVENEITPIEFYEKNGFGAITPHVGEKVNAWIDDLSESLVLHAMKIAIENGALRWNYVESILKNWSTQKISSVEEVVALQEKWRLQHSPKHSKSVREEKVPEWFGKDADQPAPKTKSVVMDIEAERKRLRQELLGG